MKNNRRKSNREYNGFPSPYVSNEEKGSDDYAKRMFKAILDATALFRENNSDRINSNRQYARGKQPLQQYLDELNIEGSKQYVNINYKPTPILQKFEKIVVDDYQQLDEKPKVIAKAYHIQERKERAKSDLKFRMEFKEQIANIEQVVGFPIEDESIKVPEDDDELNLIASLNSDEREELLLQEMVEYILEQNDLESKKRLFLSDIFQVNFAGYHHYTDRKGKIQIDSVAIEDALFDTSMCEEMNKDMSYAGKATSMTVGELRDKFNIPAEKEMELHKLAYSYRNDYGNYGMLSDRFQHDWRKSPTRPYDDFKVDVYHIWKKTIKNVGFTEGRDSYGKKVFDIDNTITSVEYKADNRKRTGVVYPETSYEGWFAGNINCPVVLEWGESVNQTREGTNKEKILCPYIFFMPDNRGTMMDMSAVERVIPEIQTLDISMLKIKMTLANHPPAGYAVDYQSMMDVDLGDGTLSPLDLDSIYQQTGKLYIKRLKEDGSKDNSLPITPLDINIQNSINTYLLIYNNAMNNIRDILGINPNREGTANLSRVSTSLAQTQISISQTATYYIYRAFLKATETLIRHLGIRIIDVLTYGSPDKGYLKFLGEKNIEFIKSRKDILASNYQFKLNPQMTKEDEERLVALVNASVTARELTMPDALLIFSIKDVDIAEKYIRYLFNKNKKQALKESQETQQLQAQAQGDMAVRAEEAKQQTITIQSQLQAQEWKIKGDSTIESKIMDMALKIMEAQLNGQAVPEEYAQLPRIVMDNAVLKQEKSLANTEKEIEAEVNAENQDAVIQQLQAQVEAGEITPEEAEQQLQQMGV